MALSNYSAAIADYTQAITLGPTEQGVYYFYFCRGIAELYAGSLPDALADQSRVNVPNNTNYAYAAIWIDIVNRRSNLPSRLAQATAQIDMTRWPAPVIQLYLGLLTPAAVLAAAKGDQVCEANFYTGELDLLNGAKADATPLFLAAAAGCAKNVAAYAAGLAELKVLGLKP